MKEAYGPFKIGKIGKLKSVGIPQIPTVDETEAIVNTTFCITSVNI